MNPFAVAGPPRTVPRSPSAKVRMMAPAVEGVDRKFTELLVRATSPYPNPPHCPTVAVTEGVNVLVAVRVGVRVAKGVRVIVGVDDIVGESEAVALGATPTRTR